MSVFFVRKNIRQTCYVSNDSGDNRTTDVTLYDSEYWRTKSIRSMFMLRPGFMWSDQLIKPDGRIDMKFSQISFPTSFVVNILALSREHGLTVIRKPLIVSIMQQ